MKKVGFGLICLIGTTNIVAGQGNEIKETIKRFTGVESDVRRIRRLVDKAVPNSQVHIEGLKTGLIWAGGVSLANLVLIAKGYLKAHRVMTDVVQPAAKKKEEELKPINEAIEEMLKNTSKEALFAARLVDRPPATNISFSNDTIPKPSHNLRPQDIKMAWDKHYKKTIDEATKEAWTQSEFPSGGEELIAGYTFVRFIAIFAGWIAHNRKVTALKKSRKIVLYSKAAQEISETLKKFNGFFHLLDEKTQNQLYSTTLEAACKLEGLVLPDDASNAPTLPEKIQALEEAVSDFAEEQIENEASLVKKIKWGRPLAALIGIVSPY